MSTDAVQQAQASPGPPPSSSPPSDAGEGHPVYEGACSRSYGRLTPASLTLYQGESATFTSSAFRTQYDSESWWVTPTSLGAVDAKGVFKAAKDSEGAGTVWYCTRGMAFTAAVTVLKPTCKDSVGPGIPPPASVRTGIPGLHADWFGQSGYPTLCPGSRSTATIAFYNSGSVGWALGAPGRTAYLGTWGPEPGQDRPSRLGGDGTNATVDTGWPSFNRVARQPAAYVGPGQVAWFQFTIESPSTPGTYKLYLRPLIEGTMWLEDAGVYWLVTVLGRDGKPVVERSLTLVRQPRSPDGSGHVALDPEGRFDGQRWWYPAGTKVAFKVLADDLESISDGWKVNGAPAASPLTMDSDKIFEYGFRRLGYISEGGGGSGGGAPTPSVDKPTARCDQEYFDVAFSGTADLYMYGPGANGRVASWTGNEYVTNKYLYLLPGRYELELRTVRYGTLRTTTYIPPCGWSAWYPH